uniref:CpsB/CapC family capsule biosynthesis tyrosine phosphatase n=1 Tax=Acetatifactor sp. TaxID=1872090 RepID=UPI004055F1E7
MNYIDIHSHILPCMDDGAKNRNDTLEMLQTAYQEGISHIIATPHYKSGRFPANAMKLQETLSEVQQLAREHGIPVSLYAGNEIYYHSEIEELFDKKDLCTLNNSQYVLIEFSPFERYIYIRNAIEDVLGMGYIPILAHVERYECMCKNIKNVEELKSIGCEIQVNAGSVTGDNGWKIKKMVQKLLKRELIDYIGTDAHNTMSRKPAMKKCAAYLYKKCEETYADAILFGNANKNLIQNR